MYLILIKKYYKGAIILYQGRLFVGGGQNFYQPQCDYLYMYFFPEKMYFLSISFIKTNTRDFLQNTVR